MSDSLLTRPSAEARATGTDADALLADLAASRVRSGSTPAIALSARIGGRDAFAASGDRGDGIPPDAGTVFRIASVTKSFTAARALQLRDAGALDLDRPVADLLPAAVFRPAGSGARITPRMLLTMSAGLPTDDAWADRLESMTAADFDALLAAGIRLVREPGTGFEYANLGWAMLGRILEHLDGRPLPQQVEAEILDPLGLTGVRFTAPTGRPLATGHARRAAGWEAQPLTGPGAFSAIGGIFASTADLLDWAAWLASAFSRPDDDRVLAAASRREMQQLHRTLPPEPSAPSAAVVGYGYGLFVELVPELGRVVSHSGGYPGFSAHLRWGLDREVIVCGLENGGYSGAWEPTGEAFSRLAAQCPEPSVRPWAETEAAVALTRALAERPDDDARWSSAERDAFAPCVALDLPIAERRAALLRVRDELGPGARLAPEGIRYPTAASARWRMIGRDRQCDFALELTPTDPPLIQRFDARPAGREEDHAEAR
ncbi:MULTISPECIES: serine hydrolase domain-containing protein [unclassified Leucobacter]|uniref:serine hydrolase domain-containing protein n=1 Tax=unclassified Leucobacter TaxID=2621730 RepID=UPI00069A8CA0|nr:serine hydrolase domain-containing protein [Leucobacter sp. Ag1]